jgi:hemin uptake protein HemP
MTALKHMNNSPATTVPPGAVQHNIATNAANSTPPPLQSAVLLRGQKSVAIEHLGQIYRLQVTKLGKLILTK